MGFRDVTAVDWHPSDMAAPHVDGFGATGPGASVNRCTGQTVTV